MFIQFFDDTIEEEFEAHIDKHAALMNDDDLLEMMKEITLKEKDSENKEEP